MMIDDINKNIIILKVSTIDIDGHTTTTYTYYTTYIYNMYSHIIKVMHMHKL